jgi:peptidoglycan/xylan/chitin deacetylase (PgdA/CDA1 family)
MAAVYGTLEGGREILLTFDDGPHLKWTPILLDYLKEAEIKAVFFVLGQCVAAKGGREIVKRAFDEGHRIANHSYSHPDLTKLSEEKVRKEILSTEELIRELMGPQKLFRPPYGAHNSTVDRVLRELGYTTMLWSVDPEDWKKTNQPSGWIDLACNAAKARGHSVVLCHDIHASTVQNFQAFIEAARKIPKATFVTYA